MTEIKLVKRYPHIKDEDVTSIFQEGYFKGYENGRKDAIPIEWIEMFMQKYKIQGDDEYKLLHFMVTEWEKWEKENE